jgi:hypothetical protein
MKVPHIARLGLSSIVSNRALAPFVLRAADGHYRIPAVYREAVSDELIKRFSGTLAGIGPDQAMAAIKAGIQQAAA